MGDQNGKQLKVALVAPESTPSFYATNLVVHHTKHEFSITFFEVKPPLLYGTSEQKQRQVEETTEIVAPAIVRIVVAASRMRDFVEVLRKNLETFQQTVEPVESKE